MNKQQYKAYRRNQRICYDSDEGYPNSQYFNLIPMQRKQDVMVYQYKDGVTDSLVRTIKWLRDRNVPEAELKRQLKQRMRCNLAGGRVYFWQLHFNSDYT